MSKRLDITRRDFLGGMALGLAAGTSLSPLELLAREHALYPPGLLGLRGSHEGSFEVLHGIAREGRTRQRPASLSDDVYDLVVVGGGISGLAAAFFYRQQTGPDTRVLVLDNHDDFGGHAIRNEFTVDGRRLIGYGGSMSIDTPSGYSAQSARLLRDVGIEVGRFYDYFDHEFFSSRGLERGVYFSAGRYGRDVVRPSVLYPYGGEIASEWRQIVAGYPLSPDGQASFAGLFGEPPDFLADRSPGDKAAILRQTSYSEFLRRHGVHEDVVLFFRDILRGYWGVGFDALSALEAARWQLPGTGAVDRDYLDGGNAPFEEPYIFHFPDGNAGIARALVRRLVPDAVPGPATMEGLVASRIDYGLLDRRGNRTRLRLGSTAVDVRHAGDGKAVDVTYVRNGDACRVRGKHAILACYNRVVPYICPELPEEQAQAIRIATKVPIAYINIALRNWRAFAELGFHEFYVPQADLMHSFGLDFPVSMGDYRFAASPSDPIVIHGSFVPTVPDKGLTEREQHVSGRAQMLEMSFDDYETPVIRQLSGALGSGGFDAERDIAAITVNRWPHGYAYEYNELYDPPDWTRADGPHRIGARPVGRISIANSDAEAYAYADGAIDAAWRAVGEQLSG